jgi:release factor glutamine methyltransferase
VGGAAAAKTERRRSSFEASGTGIALGHTMRIITLPGVFQPRSDTWMLAEALREHLRPGGHVLDLCTGSGALAVTAALHGAGRTVAVDVSRRAVLTAWCNARLNGVRLRAIRGDLFEAVPEERFDVIVSNPPYLPDDSDELPTRGARRAWDAGRDGRVLLDRICREAADHLRPAGVLLLVQSSVIGEDATLGLLARHGLEPSVLVRRHGPLGPLLSARAPELEAKGMLEPGRRTEDILVVGGRR